MNAYKFVSYINKIKDSNSFGNFIKTIRIRKNISTKFFIQQVGIPYEILRAYEKGDRLPDNKIKEKIIKFNETYY